jgi:hypothetical protein
LRPLFFICAFLFGASAFSAELNYSLLSCHGRLISPFRYNLAKEKIIIADNEGTYAPAHKAASLSYNLGLAMSSINTIRAFQAIAWAGNLGLTASKLGLPETVDGCKVLPLVTGQLLKGWEKFSPVGDRELMLMTPTSDWAIYSLLYAGFSENFLRDLYAGRFESMKTRQKSDYVANLPELSGGLHSMSPSSFSYSPPGLDQVAIELEKCTWWNEDIPKDCVAASRPLLCEKYEWGEGYCNSFFGDKVFLEWRDPISFWPNGRLKELRFWHNYPATAIPKIKLPKDVQHPQDLVECGVGTISYSENGILQACPGRTQSSVVD